MIKSIEKLPDPVISADWSVNEKKCWMVRAELFEGTCYLIFPPEPVGKPSTLIERVRTSLPQSGTGLIGFDFPIGLPEKYADRVGVSHWREALVLD